MHRIHPSSCVQIDEYHSGWTTERIHQGAPSPSLFLSFPSLTSLLLDGLHIRSFNSLSYSFSSRSSFFYRRNDHSCCRIPFRPSIHNIPRFIFILSTDLFIVFFQFMEKQLISLVSLPQLCLPLPIGFHLHSITLKID